MVLDWPFKAPEDRYDVELELRLEGMEKDSPTSDPNYSQIYNLFLGNLEKWLHSWNSPNQIVHTTMYHNFY